MLPLEAIRTNMLDKKTTASTILLNMESLIFIASSARRA
jgi:hypothetical protein